MDAKPARLAAVAALAVTLCGCVTSPKQTVLNLDTTDRKWTSRSCVAARKQVARYDDQAAARGVVGVVGNLIAPLAGTATSLAMSASRDDERARLNHKVRSSCISDPLAGKRRKVASARR